MLATFAALQKFLKENAKEPECMHQNPNLNGWICMIRYNGIDKWNYNINDETWTYIHDAILNG